MAKHRALIFPAGSDNALELYDSLRYSSHFEVFGGTSCADKSDLFYPGERLVHLPWLHEADFIRTLDTACARHGIEIIFATHDTVLLELVKNRGKIGATVLGCDRVTAELCRYKNRLYEYFAGEEFIPAWTMDAKNPVALPAFLKPVDGEGAKNCHKISDGTNLAIPDGMMLCEYLPGSEYTVDCFTDRHGKLLFVGVRTRDVIREGVAQTSRPVSNPEIERLAAHLNRRLRFRGLWFFQVKLDTQNRPKLLEISSRIATSMGVYRQLGVNLPLMTAYDGTGSDILALRQSFPMRLQRISQCLYKTELQYDTIFIDYDDTLVVNGNVNAQLVRFIYQAINEGRRIVLLTRHDGDIYGELASRRLCAALFDEIIHLGVNEDKLPYVKKNSIYIDNMFHDRKRIHENTGIPVFDVDAVGCLLKP